MIQLLECCEDQLRKTVTNSGGGSLAEKQVKEVLATIKKFAVRNENTMLSRINLHNMRQNHGENVRSYGSRINSQASTCKYQIECTKCKEEVDYTDAVLRDVLIKGLEDKDIQSEILGSADQDMPLDKVFKMIETKESGKMTASKLNEDQCSNAASAYKKKQKVKPAPVHTDKDICTYCGRTGHGVRANLEIRKKKCPAYGETCKKCHLKNHFKSVCRMKLSNDEAAYESGDESKETEAEVIIATAYEAQHEEMNVQESQSLDHHCYNKVTNKWVKKAPEAQPYITLKVSTSAKDYNHFGYKLNSKESSSHLPVMADTGCQSTLAGLQTLAQLNIKTSDQIPVTTRMRAANKKKINILGATILRFSGIDSDGNEVETRQITYITDDSDKIFLSKHACRDLGLISAEFPVVRDESTCFASAMSCDCPKRTVPPPIPKMPFEATEANVPKLKKYILEYYASSTFNTCEHQRLPSMEGPPMSLMIDKDAKPTAYHTPLPIPMHWQEEVKRSIERDVNLGVIEPVPVGEPVTWCHRMVVCSKKNGKPRRTVDMQSLNAYATRETHHTQSPFHQARSVPAGTKKTVFDAWNGYHSVPIRKEDRHYTTFITPWGRYRYCAAPQGYIASGDGYSRRYDEIVAHIPNKTKCVDDTIMWSNSIEESFQQATNWLDVCGRSGIVLNPDKFEFAQDTVEFAGFQISKSLVKPSKKYWEAIKNFPQPRSVTDIRSWFGLINQVSFTFSMADKMLPFRKLLKPNTKFTWTEELNQAFNVSKSEIIKEINKGVQIYDKRKPTCLSTDWSKDGVGFLLSQKHCQCQNIKPFCCEGGWRPTMVGGRFTHAAESRYAPIEGEALAVVEGLNKARHFVLGCPNLIVAVDHKPLLKIFGDRSLDDIPNTRLRNLKEKTLPYSFKMVYVPGPRQKAADAISRHPSGHKNAKKLLLPDDVATVCSEITPPSYDDNIKNYVNAALHSFEPITWEKVQTATMNDSDFKVLQQTIEEGWPNRTKNIPDAVQQYRKYKDSLCTLDGVILYRDRILVPPALRREVLESLHAAHQGTSSMMSRAQSSVFWPSISKDIDNVRQSCKECCRIAPSQPSAPPYPVTMAEFPFQCICADYFMHMGNHYLVVVDRFSNWPIIEKAEGGAIGLVKCLRRIFATYGIPSELSSDGGPEFTAHETKTFLSNWQVNHRMSSVAFPHSNCRAEIGVKTAKRLITSNTNGHGSLENDRFYRALLQYRNTPDKETKMSPSMCVFGRVIKDFIPVHPGKYKPHVTWQKGLAARETALRARCMRTAEYWKEHTKKLQPLRVGDPVWIQNQTGPEPNRWDKTGVVVEVQQYDQYVIKVDGSGRATLRNRKFLRKYIPIHPKKNPVLNSNMEKPPSMPFNGFMNSNGPAEPPTSNLDADPTPTQGSTASPGTSAAPEPRPTPRRSNRLRRPTKFFVPS